MNADHARRARTVGLSIAVLGLSACSWFTDFKEQPKFDPWESTSDSIPARGNPQNSVSVYGSAAPGFVISRRPLPAVIDSMSGIPNPIAVDARSLDIGRKYYTINCAVCHGFEGKGDGAAVKYGVYAPPLVGASAEGRSDGYIWGIMRNGRGGMPSYNRIEELDRWDVVNYVRGLQGRHQVATGPVGLPGETGDKVPGYTQMGPTRPSPWYIHAGSQAGPTRGMLSTIVDTTLRTMPVEGVAGIPAPGSAPATVPHDTLTPVTPEGAR